MKIKGSKINKPKTHLKKAISIVFIELDRSFTSADIAGKVAEANKMNKHPFISGLILLDAVL